MIISTPTLVRFFCPPEMPLIRIFPIMVSAQSVMPSSSNRLFTILSIVSVVVSAGSRNSAEKVSASRGVAVAISASSCIT